MLKYLKSVILILISLAFILLIYYTWVKSPVLTHGFASYYTSAKMLTDGSDMTRAYDTVYYYSKMHEYGFGSVKDLSNLPTGSFIMLPLCSLAPVTAKIIWNILGIIFLSFSAILLFRSFDISAKNINGLIFLLLALLFYPFYYNLAYGQAYALLLLLGSISVYGFKKNNTLLIALPLALIIILKGYGFYPLAALLLVKKPKAFLLTLGIAIAIFFLTLPLFGLSAWQMYFSKFYSVVSYGDLSSTTANQTLGSLLGHLFSYNSAANTNAISSVPKIYIYYFVQLSGFLVLFLASKKFNPKNYLTYFVISFAINVIFSPAAEDYHSLFYLPLIFLTGGMFYKNIKIKSTHIYIFVFAVLLVMLPLPFRQLQDSAFPLYILAYPRLYGAVLVLYAACRFIRGGKFPNGSETISMV